MRRVAWLVVDRTGYPDGIYGPATNGGPAKAARRMARNLNETARDEEHRPWSALCITYEWPPARRARRRKP